ncbi:hypothetical protein NPIL_202601 [Nephila pilipes]|uniref:Uncharacterized protein n=1 Tax=Nephila pilipes TaxID=299642 RepID=A0A8X6R3G6_NEPPI|nr:hypothetical protein NPIL_202601 [Nephila pilipes]
MFCLSSLGFPTDLSVITKTLYGFSDASEARSRYSMSKLGSVPNPSRTSFTRERKTVGTIRSRGATSSPDVLARTCVLVSYLQAVFDMLLWLETIDS